MSSMVFHQAFDLAVRAKSILDQRAPSSEDVAHAHALAALGTLMLDIQEATDRQAYLERQQPQYQTMVMSPEAMAAMLGAQEKDEKDEGEKHSGGQYV